jgi:hypothetical protein
MNFSYGKPRSSCSRAASRPTEGGPDAEHSETELVRADPVANVAGVGEGDDELRPHDMSIQSQFSTSPGEGSTPIPPKISASAIKVSRI